MKKVKRIQLKIVIFTAVKNRCILHGRVFVMLNNKAADQTECKIIIEPYIVKFSQSE